jgi:hypothetical protein
MAVTPTDVGAKNAADFVRRAAPPGLTAAQARLYSHVTRLRAGQAGVRWEARDTDAVLTDAIGLIEAGQILRSDGQREWEHPFRRAAEVLEWLGELEGIDDQLPVRLLSAAAYQIAGYPAQARGLLARTVGATRDSALLRSLLQADFAGVEEGLRTVWSIVPDRGTVGSQFSLASSLAGRVFDEMMRVLGVFTAFMRWGDDGRLEAALRRMEGFSSLMAKTAPPAAWLLTQLTAEVLRRYTGMALRAHIETLLESVAPDGKLAFERYLRRAYLGGRALAWPSQVRGIAGLKAGKSFALCTPTGSGKTTIAELGILQSLFATGTEGAGSESALVLYITPTKALAAEVESRLSAVVRGLTSRELQVTGLYGGTDWGPSDAWLTSDAATVLICTQEKAEALLRFLGPLFVHRICLVVVDEAHAVQLSEQQRTFRDARPLRLESFLSRLLTYGRGDPRVIALSAVAGGIENTLAQWLTGDPEARAAIEPYRSTRQLVGKLICRDTGDTGTYQIEYDLLNGRRLEIAGREDKPHVPRPFDDLPTWIPDWAHVENSLRAPTLWAALQIAGGGERRQSVLVFVPERAPNLAKAFVDLLEQDWAGRKIPIVFQAPTAGDDARAWDRCLAACADFFGEESYEYRLLGHGIVLHHGKMPPSLGRLLVDVVDRRIVSIVLATSTLSEGVNLPFETVIFAAPTRMGKALDARAVANTIGRAGRPGFGTEGRALFLLPNQRTGKLWSRWNAYEKIVKTLQTDASANQAPASPLAQTLIPIHAHWRRVHPFGSDAEFLDWLEVTASADGGPSEVTDALEALDQMLIAVAVEEEQFRVVGGVELEDRLRRIWRSTYARYAAIRQEELETHFVRRGLAVPTRLYPEASQRKQIYITSLPPGDAALFLRVYPVVKSHLAGGFEYADWDSERRIAFIEDVLGALWEVPAFKPADGPGKGKNQVPWQATLRWWFRIPGSLRPRNPVDVSSWFEHVSSSYLYKAAWGIGNAIGLVTYEIHRGELQAPTHDEWPTTGLPWVTLWLKELLNWGTLDPAAAAVLNARKAPTRALAEQIAQGYYASVATLPANDRLRPSRVKTWIDALPKEAETARHSESFTTVPAVPIPTFPPEPVEWRVWPVAAGEEVQWCDVAGYPLAQSAVTDELANRGRDVDFWLEPHLGRVRGSVYLRGEL